MWSQKETIAWGPCTPPPTLETFSKKNWPVNSFQYRDSGFTEEEADDELNDDGDS